MKKTKIITIIGTIFAAIVGLVSLPSAAWAVNAAQVPPVNLTSSSFRLTVCDGPPLPAGVSPPANLGHIYVPCDFNGLMIQAQYLINVMIVVGVLAVMIGCAYAGYLYITGTQENIKRAKSIFPKLAIGFVLMLTAWFIVYQIMSWLTGNASVYMGNG